MSAVQLTRQKDDAVRPALPSPADVEQIPLEQLPRLLGELEILGRRLLPGRRSSQRSEGPCGS